MLTTVQLYEQLQEHDLVVTYSAEVYAAILLKRIGDDEKRRQVVWSPKVEICPSRFTTDRSPYLVGPLAIFGGRSLILDDFCRRLTQKSVFSIFFFEFDN